MTKMWNKKLTALLATCLVAAGVLGAATAAHASSQQEKAASIREQVKSLVPLTEFQIPALSSKRSSADALPAALDPKDLGVSGVIGSSARNLGESSVAKYFVAQDASGDVCLIIAFKEVEGFASSSCSSVKSFLQWGISAQAGTPGQIAEAYLVPTTALKAMPTIASLDGSRSANLIIGNPGASVASKITPSATIFPLPLFTSIDGLELR